MEAVSFSHKEGLLRRAAKLLVCLFTSIALSFSLIPISSLAYAAEQDGLTLTVDYDHNIKCGVPVTFTMTANGGSGNYKYLQNYMMVYADGYWQDDADWTRHQYVEENTFEYTFVAPGEYKMRVYVMDMSSYQYINAVTTITVNDPSAVSVDQEAANIANSILAKGYTSEYDKALEAHDIIAARATYDYSFTYDGVSGVLLRRTGTCESYHRAFALVLSKLGIACERAEGNDHVWSCVKLDGKWTQIDLTWDDSESATGDYAFLSHAYFGMTDEIAQMVHSDHNANTDRPCNDLSNNYFVRSGQIKDWSKDIVSEIENRIAASDTFANDSSFDVTIVPKDSDPKYTKHPTVFKAIYPVIAYDINNRTGWKGLQSGYILTSTYELQDLTKGVFHVTVQKCTHQGTVPNKWESDANSHWKKCSSCGTKTVTAGHTYSSWVTVVPATVASEGSKKRTCTTCTYAQTGTIPKLVNTETGSGDDNSSSTSPNDSINNGSSGAVKPAKTLANGTYKFRSVASKKKYVGVVKASRKAGAKVKALVAKRSKAQKFVVKYDKTTGYYTIKNVKSKKVLSVYGSKAKKGRKLVQYKDKKRLTQRWIISGNAKKGYKLASAANPKLYVEIVKASSKKDSFLRLWRGKSTKSQRFAFFKR